MTLFKKGRKPWNKGLKGYNKDYPRDEIWSKRISEGKKNSLKSTLASKENARRMGVRNINRKFKQETIEKMKISQKGKHSKEKSNWWKGGISNVQYPQEWADDLKESIRKRDNFICQECGIHQDELDYKLPVHHIDYNKNNLYPENLITLCRSCHIKTNHNREYWINYFYARK